MVSGGDIQKAQKVLNVLGYGPVEESGAVSEHFVVKLREFQRSLGVKDTGEVDDDTKAAMDKAMQKLLAAQRQTVMSPVSLAPPKQQTIAPATAAPPPTGLQALVQRPMFLGGIAVLGLIAYMMYRDSQKSFGDVEERKREFKRAAWREVEPEPLARPSRKKCGKTPDFDDGEPVEEEA